MCAVSFESASIFDDPGGTAPASEHAPAAPTPDAEKVLDKLLIRAGRNPRGNQDNRLGRETAVTSQERLEEALRNAIGSAREAAATNGNLRDSETFLEELLHSA